MYLKVLKNYALLRNKVSQEFILSRGYCESLDHFKPGLYPKTKEEREAAAAKYNLIPEDYEPYPDGSGYGDYPKLNPYISVYRNHTDYSDYYCCGRNWKETLPINDHTNYWLIPKTDNEIYRKTNKNILLFFVIPLILFVTLCTKTGYSFRVKPKQYPPQFFGLEEKNHYTFELE